MNVKGTYFAFMHPQTKKADPKVCFLIQHDKIGLITVQALHLNRYFLHVVLSDPAEHRKLLPAPL